MKKLLSRFGSVHGQFSRVSTHRGSQAYKSAIFTWGSQSKQTINMPVDGGLDCMFWAGTTMVLF